MHPRTLFGSLKEMLQRLNIHGEMGKNFTFFYLENDKLMFMINIFLILRIL